MKPERLQEIKALIHSWAYPVMGDEDRLIEVSVFLELIAALEQAQAENERLENQLADCYNEHPYIIGG